MLGRGTPSSYGGGYPIQSWCGRIPRVPHHPDLAEGGYPIQKKDGHGGGVTLGTPHIQTWLRYSLPTIQTWPGYPPIIQTWPGYPPPPSRPGQGTPPPSRPGWGTPLPPSRPGWGTPPTIQTWLGYPPPIEVWTYKQTENSTFPHPSDAGGKIL